MFEFKRYLQWILDVGITEKEYTILLCMYYASRDKAMSQVMKRYAEMRGEYVNGSWKMSTDREKAPLIERGYLGRTEEGSYFLTDSFLELFVDEQVAGNEFLNGYPAFLVINNVNVPIKTGNRQMLRRAYWNAIGGKRSEHEEVIKDMNYGYQNSLINMSVDKFIGAEYWLEFRTLRLAEKKQDYGTGRGEDF